jgi:hypothetical protein
MTRMRLSPDSLILCHTIAKHETSSGRRVSRLRAESRDLPMDSGSAWDLRADDAVPATPLTLQVQLDFCAGRNRSSGKLAD